MDIDPSSVSHADGGGDLWPFDSLTTSLFFSSVSSSPPLHPLPVASSSWLTPPSPLWLFEDRQMMPIEVGPAPAAAPDNTAAVAEEVQRARSGNSDTPIKKTERLNNKWQFNLALHDDSTNSSCLFKEKLTHALRYFKESTDQHLLVQVWAPVKSGDRYVLTTSGQPFVLDHQSIGLLQYRAVSMMYMFSVDGDNAGELGLPGRVYKQKVPEWTPNVQYYSSTEYPRLNHAISYNVHGTVALPVFDPSVQSCIAVVELIMTSKKINYADEVDKVCKALEAVNLKSTEILEHPNVQICNEGRQSALVEILEILTVVCEEHKLPLAQTWVPCKYRSVLAHGGGVKKSCLSFDGSCMGEVCMSTSDVAFHVIDAHMWGFRDACVEHHLQKGQGVSGKAFIYHRPCFSKDISQFCKLEYPLVHYARMFGLAGCFAICLQSPYTGDDYYMLEFFLPPSCKEEDDQNALLESILGLINQCLRNLKVAGNGESNEASLQLSNVIMIESEDFKTNVHFENSEGFRESPEGDTHGGAHEFDKANSKVSEGHLLADDNSQNNGVSVSRPNGSAASDSSLLHKNGKPPERRRGKAEKTISLEVLQQYFSGSLKNAAKSLGVCPTTMKRICRQHGISRWPSRKINKVNRSLSKLKQVIESVQGSDAAFNLTSITGPLPTIPVGPSSDSFNKEKASESKAEHSNCAVDGDRDSSLQKSQENGSHFGALMSQQGFADTGNNVQLEADKASLSRSSSGEGSINSRTSEGSCQGSPANQTFVCQPIASMFLEPQEPQLNPEGFTKEPFQEPELPLSRMLIEDSGSSKDLKNLFGSAIGQPMLAPPSNFGPMRNSGTVTIKASFKEDIVRFRFPCSSSVMALKDEVAKRLRMDAGMFDIKYLDDDHEWVKLACNADLEECIEISRHSGTHVIRLLVSDVAAHIGSSCGSSG
ncbi:hypothetical protein ACQJBY_026576 [Aegilops geniculata]